MCVSLKGKLFHIIKENTNLKQKVAYLTSRLERTVVSEKLIEDKLSRVEESATKSTYKLGVGFERCENYLITPRDTAGFQNDLYLLSM
jgi:predicted nuclease with TOPRIM domain